MEGENKLDIESFLHRLSDKKAIIFDMDGVIADTTQSHAEAFNDTFDKIKSLFNYKEYAGMRTDDVFRKFFSQEHLIEKLTKIKREKAIEELKKVGIYPYAKNLLKLLKNKGIKIALATSASKKSIETILSLHGLREYFDFIISGKEVKNAKPHPEIYEKALAGLNIKKEEAVVIEDAPNGISSAKMAVINVIALLHTHGQKEVENADLIFKDMYSLYSVFNYQFHNNKINITDIKEIKKVIAIIPAAGKGVRIGFDKPKILYPIAGTTPLKILYNKLKHFSSKIIVMTNPEGAKLIKEYIARENINLEIGVVYDSIGTADTILASEPLCSGTDDVLVIWGDQIGFNIDSIRQTISEHQKNNAAISIPVILKKEPYIHFKRDENGIISEVLRKRFSDIMPEYGENDSGVFVIKRDKLYETLKNMKAEHLKQIENKNNSNYISEFDFLNIIPEIAINEKVLTCANITEQETIGMNDLKEAKFHEERILSGDYYSYY